MKPMQRWGLFFALPIFLILCSPLKAQFFETTTGSTAGVETPWDGKALPSNNFIQLSTTQSFGPRKILLTQYNSAGTVTMFRTIQEAGSSTSEIEGLSIEPDYNAANTHTGYFITGYRKNGSGRQMIVMKTGLTGIVSWARILPNADGATLDECGVSVERQSNGDVIAVGKSQVVATVSYSRVVAARFTSAGALVWCFRYASNTGSSYVPAEACNGFRPSPNPGGTPFPVVAVTGKYTDGSDPNNHAFLFLINAATGAEVSRFGYPSGMLRDEGLDVVYKPAANAFDVAQYMIVGGAGAQHLGLYVIRVNAANGSSTGALYAAGVTNSGFVGRAVSMSADASGTRAVIAGTLIGMNSPTSAFFSRVFSMELPFAAGALPVWTRYYDASYPNGFGAESIHRTLAGQAGYFITGGGRFDAAGTDQHAVRVNSTGITNSADCKVVVLSPTHTKVGTSSLRSTTKTPVSIWSPVTLSTTSRTWKQVSCSSGGGFEGEGGDDRAMTETEITGAEIVLAPNPVAKGSAANLILDMPESETSAWIQLFDMNGKQYVSFSQNTGAGRIDVPLPTENLPAGIYLVQVKTETMQKTLKLMVQQ